MSEAGGPATQAGVRYQDQVAALYLGRMIDPRERPRHDQPVEVRIEAPQSVDDFVVQFADGGRRFFQVKLSLDANGLAWKALWPSFLRQLETNFTSDDRLELVLGASSSLASQLSEITKRHEGSDLNEWHNRLTNGQRRLVSSIQELLSNDIQNVWRVVKHLDISIWPADCLVRDFLPQWMPLSTVPSTILFKALTDMVWEGAHVRMRFDGATLYDRLRSEALIIVSDPSNWGSAKYRDAIAALSMIEVPGTEFSHQLEGAYLWPKCLRYDRDRQPDFDDDLPGWRNIHEEALVDLCDFPSIDLGAVVVIAGPGFGKTTLVHAIARKVALTGLLPAIVPITKLSDSDLSIADYLSQKLNGEFDVRIDWRAAANAGALVLLLDGLDEVSNDRRTLILERLRVYCATHSGVRWLMTVRDAAALSPPRDVTMVELMPLRDEDIAPYVDFYRPGEPGLAQTLLDRIDARPDLAHLVRIPIFLALLLVMRQEHEDLRRSDLLDSYLETLFRPSAFKSTQKFDPIDTTMLRRIAEHAAFDALETDTLGLSIRGLDRCIRDLAPALRTDDVREALIRRGVLRREGLVRLAFPFPIVQEYLASAELLESHLDQLAQRLFKIAKRPWAQAIQFALERHPDPGSLIDEILEQEDDVFHTGLRLLGRCLANGMTVTNEQRQSIGDRITEIWGNVSWRTSRLIDGIIVDAFSLPLHSAVRARLGERHLLHNGIGTILARHRDASLTLAVLSELLDGDIEHMLNISDLQQEVNRLGTSAFDLYIARSRLFPRKVEDGQAISCLIGHMSIGCVDKDVAFAAASDETLPLEVRLVAWSHSMRKLEPAIEELIVLAMASDGYHSRASAAQALSSPQADTASILRLLRSPQVPEEQALQTMEHLIGDWGKVGRSDKVNELLAAEDISEKMRDIASLYAVNSGNLEAFDTLLDRIHLMSADMVSGTVIMFGHVLDRSRVDRAVSAIARRRWETGDRLLIAGSLSTGLTYRLNMMGVASGTLEPSPPHPGRTIPFSLFEQWIAQADYKPHEHLRLTLDAVRLGVPGIAKSLRPLFDSVIAMPASGKSADGSLEGSAVEALYTIGDSPPLIELERLASSGTYNFASRVVGVIAKGGTMIEAETLMRIYEAVPSKKMLRSVIMGVLEPLAGRLGLRITFNGEKLTTKSI
ncbi:NACHT domain-containing NTPase [Pseudomonas sp. S09G 359]|uniref:NACHT domain-containing protein n=1 Tax=Pseudomonas sp. S09G 359 TaxID=2054919 RepID=UPI0012FF40CB|nr:NACHT domain-containing protein [Pseudomonas sp. S09G 359]